MGRTRGSHGQPQGHEAGSDNRGDRAHVPGPEAEDADSHGVRPGFNATGVPRREQSEESN